MWVNRIARAHRGVKTWGFSQSSPRSWVHYAKYGPRGICAALSAHWIKTHAVDDKSLPDKLGLTPCSITLGPIRYPTYRSLNTGELVKVAKDFHFWTNGGGRQRDNIDNWLIHNGLTKAKEYCTSWADLALQNLAPIVPGNPQPPANPIPPVNRCLVNAFGRFQETYGYVSISSRRAGHAIAVWIADERIPTEVGALFFDPNYGEYRFPSKNDFLNFFDAFYRHAYLSRWQAYSGQWNVNAYKISAW